MKNKTNTETYFIKLFKRFPSNADKYDYSGTVVDGMSSKITYICKVCGHVISNQNANDHYQGYGCQSCVGRVRYNKEHLISKSVAKFGDIYDFTVTSEFSGKKTKILIGCPVHGVVETTAQLHLKSVTGCPKCYRIEYQEVLNRFYSNPHNTLNSLPSLESELEGKSSYRYVTGLCHRHGEYKVSLLSVLRGSGCSKCNYERHSGVYTLHLANKNKEQLLEKPSGIYLLSFKSNDSSFFKIGISADVYRRVKELSKASSCDVSILYYGETNAYDAIQLEQNLLSSLGAYKHLPEDSFQGSTELFNVDNPDLISDLIELMSTLTEEVDVSGDL